METHTFILESSLFNGYQITLKRMDTLSGGTALSKLFPTFCKGITQKGKIFLPFRSDQGPVVQSVVSLTSPLRVISLTVLADSIYNILTQVCSKQEVKESCIPWRK